MVCPRTNPKCRLRERPFSAAFAPGFVSRWDTGDELVGAGRRDFRLSPAPPELPQSRGMSDYPSPPSMGALA